MKSVEIKKFQSLLSNLSSLKLQLVLESDTTRKEVLRNLIVKTKKEIAVIEEKAREKESRLN